MNKPWKIILVFIAIFACGAVTGGIISYRWIHHPIRRPNMERFAKNRVMHLSQELKCTPDQQDKLEIIVTQAGMNLRHLRQNTIRTAMTIFDHMDSQIETVLTPEQRTKFEQLRAVEKARFRGFIHAPGAPKGPPGQPGAEEDDEHAQPPAPQPTAGAASQQPPAGPAPQTAPAAAPQPAAPAPQAPAPAHP